MKVRVVGWVILLALGTAMTSAQDAVTYEVDAHEPSKELVVSATFRMGPSGMTRLDLPRQAPFSHRNQKRGPAIFRRPRLAKADQGNIEHLGGGRYLVRATKGSEVEVLWKASPSPDFPPGKGQLKNRGVVILASEILFQVGTKTTPQSCRLRVHAVGHPSCVIEATSFEELRSRIAHLGRFTQIDLPAQRARLQVTPSATWEGLEHKRFLDAIRRLLAEQSALIDLNFDDKTASDRVLVTDLTVLLRPGPVRIVADGSETLMTLPANQVTNLNRETLIRLARHLHLARWRQQLIAHSADREDMGRHRWLYDGFPRYYGGRAAQRAGLMGPTEFLRRMRGLMLREASRRRARGTDVVTAGRRAQVTGRYDDDSCHADERGALIAFCLDAQGLQSNSRARSAALIPFAQKEDFDLFRMRFIEGSRALPFPAAAKTLGLSFHREDWRRDFSFGWSHRDQGVVVTDPKKSKLRRGDFLLAIDGQQDYVLRDYLRPKKKASEHQLRFARGQREFERKMRFLPRRHWQIALGLDASAEEPALARRRSWFQTGVNQTKD